MKLNLRQLAIFAFACFLQPLFARLWTLNNGTSHEGEVYKCTLLKLTIINAEKKRTTIDLDDLSDKDKAYLKKAYPEFFAAAKNAPIAEGDNSVESSPKYLKWPDIKIKKDDISFRWDSKRGRFYTRHYRFDMKKRLSEADALTLAALCESTYESVRLMPFWPNEFKRAYSAGPKDEKLKFNIEINNISMSRIAGYYTYTYNAKGRIISDLVIVEPKFISIENSREKGFAGTLAHELAHQLTSIFGGGVVLKEGLAQFIQYGILGPDGTVHYGLYEKLFKHNGNKRLKIHSLSKFMLMPKKKFENSSTVAENYFGAHLIFTYFALQEPDILAAS